MRGLSVTLKFRPLRKGEETEIEWLRSCFDALLDNLIGKKLESGEINLRDRVSIVLRNDPLGVEPIFISFRQPDQFHTSAILERIAFVTPSKKDFCVKGSFELLFQHVKLPYGAGGGLKLQGYSMAEYAKRKYGLLTYKVPPEFENDNLCLAYCLVFGIAVANKDRAKIRSCKRTYAKLREAALSLCADANVSLSNGGGYDEIDRFQTYLADYQITVYSNRYGNEVFYQTVKDPSLKMIDLIIADNHFYTITSLTAAFACSYFCHRCHKGSNSRLAHRCPYRCTMCFGESKCVPVDYKDRVYCGNCNRRFKGYDCFANHLKNGVCAKFKVCPKCDKIYDASRSERDPHKCGESYCSVCAQKRPIIHDCFMPKFRTNRDYDYPEDDENKPYDPDDPPSKCRPLFVFCDLETTQNFCLDGHNDRFEHRPNVCVTNNLCKWCIEEDEASQNVNEPCEKCGNRLHVFEGPVCIENLMQYIFRNEEFDRFSTIVVMAHNLGMFDGHFILQHIYKHGGYGNPSVIMNGTKIISLSLGKVRLIDSLNYFLKPLAALPAMFNFPEQKGYYPHFFNTDENYNYIGPIPDIKYFDPDSKMPEDRKKLLEWYDEQKKANVIFDNRLELIKYCKMDVEILRKACSIFRKSFWDSNHVDPFLDACTIPSACNKVFRSNFLERDMIGIIPKTGYRFRNNQSLIGLKWLCWLEMLNDTIIEHAGRKREKYLDGIGFVDGYHPETNMVFEFQGCYYHGCETCYPQQNSDIDAADVNQMFARSERSAKKLEKIRQAGYDLVVKKECEFRRELKEDPGIEICLLSNPLITTEPLNPRHAFYGGRTNASVLYYKCKDGEKIKYLDMISLYPFINKTYKIPIKHPTVHIGEEECRKLDINTVEGLIKCTVLGPKKLLFPVLPSHIDDKLVFHTCRTCSHKRVHNSKCVHKWEDRLFSGTWVADEVRKAIQKGYKIIEIHEIWAYEVMQYNPETKSGSSFAAYIDNFIKIKTYASGFPKTCKTPEQKAKFIQDFKEKEGIELDPALMIKNPSLRCMSKTTVNSFWGKFGQLTDKPNMAIISDAASLFRLFTDPDVIMLSILPIDSNRLIVSYQKHGEGQPLNHVNVAIAAYTTAGARLELYKYLELLGDRILYYDTDSIMYVERPGDTPVPTGIFLGDMKDELEDDFGIGSYGSELAAGGPKNYALRVYSPNKTDEDGQEVSEDQKFSVIMKIKGIRLNHTNSDLINFDKVKEIICENNDEQILLDDNKILRTKTSDVYSVKRKKTYRMCYTKRMRLADGINTLPWGY